MRLYNGEWQQDATGVANVVLLVSGVLAPPTSDSRTVQFHDSTHTALDAVLERSLQPLVRNSVDFSYAILNDLAMLLQPQDEERAAALVLAALADVYRIFHVASKAHQSDADVKKNWMALKRKAHFYMVWSNEACDTSLLHELGSEVRTESTQAAILLTF